MIMGFARALLTALLAIASAQNVSAENAQLRVWLAYSPQQADPFSTRMGQLLRAELMKLPRLKVETIEEQQNSVPVRIELLTVSDGRLPTPPRLAGVFYTGVITLQDPRTGEYVSWDARIGFSGDDPDSMVQELIQWIDNKTEPAMRMRNHWAETACDSSKPAE